MTKIFMHQNISNHSILALFWFSFYVILSENIVQKVKQAQINSYFYQIYMGHRWDQAEYKIFPNECNIVPNSSFFIKYNGLAQAPARGRAQSSPVACVLRRPRSRRPRESKKEPPKTASRRPNRARTAAAAGGALSADNTFFSRASRRRRRSPARRGAQSPVCSRASRGIIAAAVSRAYGCPLKWLISLFLWSLARARPRAPFKEVARTRAVLAILGKDEVFFCVRARVGGNFYGC